MLSSPVPGLSKYASNGKVRRVERGIGKSESKAILQHIGVFLPVGSGKYTFFSYHFRAFLAVMADVIKQITTTIPALKTVSFRQDSAGCYHCRACRATIVWQEY